MSFISLEFVIFMFIVVPVYFMTPHRLRWVLLLGASYYFYTRWNLNYIVLIVFSTLIDYVVSVLLGITQNKDTDKKRLRQMLLFTSIFTNLGVLFVFKYFNFFAESFNTIAETFLGTSPIPALNVLLPVGISFYTFQSMAYTIDVYRGNVQPERNLGRFATYIAFFPQLVAGPIERAGNLLPQFHKKHHFVSSRVVSGLRLILWGAFKKVVIADRMAVFVNHIYGNPEGFGGGTMVIATIFFGIQIYGDFSGYSDIAIGTARILGFDLMTNFRQPYLATSIRDFWRRWHISLSTWFRDYLYFPLGGSRVSVRRNLLNLFIVFLVSGLWHGAAWTFVIWGAVHGIFIGIETIVDKSSINIPQFLQHTFIKQLYTFSIVTILWAFFRANQVNDVFYMFTNLAQTGQNLDPMGAYTTGYFLPAIEFSLSIFLIGLLFFVDWADQKYDIIANFGVIPILPRYIIYYFLAFCVIASYMMYGLSIGPSFIYFQF